jgi:predicted transcriptional regulator
MKIDISDAEYLVMSVVWANHPATAKQLFEHLNNEWHIKTLNTLLNRLVKKGALAYTKSGRQFVYSPLLEKKQYTHQKSKNFLETLYGGKLSPLVAQFAEQESLIEEDIEALKKLIDDWEKKNV